MITTSRLQVTGVTGGPLRITGASLVNGAYELATAGGADYELQTERQTMLSEILFIPGLQPRSELMGEIVFPANVLQSASNQPVVLSSDVLFSDRTKLSIDGVPTICQSQYIPDVSNGTWTFWNQPKSAWDSVNKITTLGPFVTAGGNVLIYQYNGTVWSSFTLLSGGTLNDHNDGACILLPNGRLFVAYTGHNVANYFYRVSTDHTIANLGAQQTIGAMGLSSPEFSYTQLSVLASEGSHGRLYLRFRHGPSSNRPRYYSTVELDAGGDWPASPTWANAVVEIQNGTQRPYLRMWDNGTDTVALCFNDGHPDQAGTTNVYYAKYDGAYKNGSGGAITLPVTPSNATLVHSGGANRIWNLDVTVSGSNVGVLFIEYEGGPANQTLKLAVSSDSGATWAIHTYGPTGPGFALPLEPYYPGGASFVKNNPNEFFVSAVKDGQYAVNQVRFSAGVFSVVRQITPEGNQALNIRPEAIAAGAHFDVAWLSGHYEYYLNTTSSSGVKYLTSSAVYPPVDARSLFVYRDDVSASAIQKRVTIKKAIQPAITTALGSNALFFFGDAAIATLFGDLNLASKPTITAGFLVRTKGATSDNQTIASNWDGANAGLLIRLNTSLALNCNFRAIASSPGGTTTATVSPNVWTLVGMQITGSNVVGRVGKTKQNVATTSLGLSPNNSANKWSLGYSQHSGVAAVFNGEIAFGFVTEDVLNDAQWDNLVDMFANLDESILTII